MLLIFSNNLEPPDVKYVESGSNIKRRDYTGKNSRAIVPDIIVCNQNLTPIFETDELENYINRRQTW